MHDCASDDNLLSPVPIAAYWSTLLVDSSHVALVKEKENKKLLYLELLTSEMMMIDSHQQPATVTTSGFSPTSASHLSDTVSPTLVASRRCVVWHHIQ